MVDKHGLIVECAYNQIEKKLDNYHTTFDQQKKNEYLFNHLFQYNEKRIN